MLELLHRTLILDIMIIMRLWCPAGMEAVVARHGASASKRSYASQKRQLRAEVEGQRRCSPEET
jgi:hypothetical protein